jgi:hypothetical protein
MPHARQHDLKSIFYFRLVTVSLHVDIWRDDQPISDCTHQDRLAERAPFFQQLQVSEDSPGDLKAVMGSR